ncbi:mannose-1-phosphate guanylyltransferase/mannose-6-phosphate isomerase [Devosia psychrophila]|uniref:mannose-1-phosphate guanylyltransferase n=1 Tax=Devosia psychrophila TaxID=728005 RepID=A0A0F5PZW7_9HYPH|nr:mannose-1-phosphate guanylyltransferase/mannose-6-phosphate isomerase [Devosia psychrophila]KKC33946.1 mannose-1-phosphate guanyltransferase [Devosia psychrophila]SFD17851.1 mannose-1-phosphate guanylyltransferase [Devosia psychrophila]
MSHPIVPVILAGGQGTRLWPMSRTARPKQFLPLTGEFSLFQQTLSRVADLNIYARPIVITNSEYRFIVAEQALEVGSPLSSVLLEPVARNTAVAIAAAAAFASARFGSDAVLHILPSDHDVIVDGGYRSAITQAAEAASKGLLVTFGIIPTHAETGYGYIKSAASAGGKVASVERFVEKPNQARAQEMLAEGGYLWNSGMFMIGATAFLDECATLAPQTLAAARGAIESAKIDLDFVRLDETAFARAPNISVDYAIFEKTTKAAVIAVNFGWSDLGSWDAVWKNGDRDSAQNFTKGNVTLDNVSNSLIASDHAHVAVSGLDDIAVIATDDAVYVGKLSEAQNVGSMVKVLKAHKSTSNLTEIHKTAFRPWGGYSSILNGERFQVKRLFVKPGKKLSLQKHHHRAEHWIVVRGTADVTIDGAVTTLAENQSIYLPLGCVHRLSNPGKIELELIEVQTGSYLGEDDIIRIEDEFGRV